MKILRQLTSHQNLSSYEAKKLLNDIAAGIVTPIQISAILTALSAKGETPAEISGFIQAMRQNMLTVSAPKAIDVCGTGGDNSNTFNISTAVAFVVAGCGVKVAKHGNRAASSKCGSADVLETLGVNIQLSPSRAKQVLRTIGMVFLFAPLYHPAMKQVALVRKELGIPTIFNLLGPFANPAQVKHQLIGVSNLNSAQKLAQAAATLNYTRLVIVTSLDGLDEVSLNSKTTALIVEGTTVTLTVIDPTTYGFKPGHIMGGNARTNANIIRQVLTGKTGPHRNVVVLNSAVALYAAKIVPNIKAGIPLAQKSIDSGQAKHVLEHLCKS